MALKQIKVSEVLELLKNGYTRWEADATEPGKSIETKLGLSKGDANTLYGHPKIKRIKTVIKTLEIIDDTEEEPPVEVEAIVVVDDMPAGGNSGANLSAQLGTVVSPRASVVAPAVEAVLEPVAEPELDPFA